MKKIILVLAFLVICGRAWALPDNVISQEYNSDTQIKSSSGYVYDVEITFTGASVGDEAWLWDATSAQPVSNLSSFRCHVTTATANSSVNCGPYTSANLFNTAIYFGYRSSGKVTADIQWQ